MAKQDIAIQRLGLTWQPGAATGWGLLGLHLSLRLIARGIIPAWFFPPDWRGVDRLHRMVLAAAEPINQKLAKDLAASTGKQISVDGPVLVALGNEFNSVRFPFALQGNPDIGMIFSENSSFSPQAVERGKSLAKIIAGSSWCAEVLREHGLTNVSIVLQGIDPTLFHPAPRSGLWKNRFVIFSGGKLEYRKGQDIVIAAVREFRRKHPETVLIFAWHNAWPQTMKEIDRAGLVEGCPAVATGGEIDFSTWLKKQNMANFVDLGPMVQGQIAPLIREADVAIFPNRCEGGTNLVAMECMASGVPTILSANTGHLDLISDQTCFPLRDQKPVKPTEAFASVKGWGESSVDELVQTLEQVHANRPEAQRRAAAAAAVIGNLTWERFTDELLEEIAGVQKTNDK